MPTLGDAPELLPVDIAIERVTAAFAPLPGEIVSLAEAGGRVLAEDISARATYPPTAVSAMDGYAVRAIDVREALTRLRVVGAVPAGTAYGEVLAPGETVRIFAGAPLPQGADSVVIQENAVLDGDWVDLNAPAIDGQHVRKAGLDFRRGQSGLKAGTWISARDQGLAAAMDVPWLWVRRRPRVAILATGDEIALPGETRGAHQIVGGNNVMLAGLVRDAGGTPIDLGVVPDDASSLRHMAANASGADILVTTGGVSVGEHDLVRAELGKDGFRMEFWRVAMRPGKPVMFGHLHGLPLLGLPGNPVSAYVCGVVFLRPALRRMLGMTETLAPSPVARLGGELAENDRRQDYLRARLSCNDIGELVATPFTVQDSAMLSVLAAADCLIVRPPRAARARVGDRVSIVIL